MCLYTWNKNSRTKSLGQNQRAQTNLKEATSLFMGGGLGQRRLLMLPLFWHWMCPTLYLLNCKSYLKVQLLISVFKSSQLFCSLYLHPYLPLILEISYFLLTASLSWWNTFFDLWPIQNKFWYKGVEYGLIYFS